MSKSNGFLPPLLLLLVTFSVSLPKSLVCGSPVRQGGFNRPDPLRHFKPYNGTYDIRNRHYWASAAFTGVHGYAMAGVWILGGLGYGIFVAVKNLSGSSSAITEHSDSYYLIPFLVIVLFTILSIIACSLVLVANRRSMWRAEKLKQTIIGAARDAYRTIRKVTRAMKEMRHLLRPYNSAACFRLKSTSRKLERSSKIIRRVLFNNRRSIDFAIQTSYWVTAGVISIDLVMVIAALVMLSLHWRPGFLMIIFLCWIITGLCWVLTGFHFFILTVAEETCAAFKEFERSPDNSSLGSVLPCIKKAHADRIMVDIGSKIHNFINELNSNVTKISRVLGLDEQSEVQMSRFWKVCDPFPDAPDYMYNPNACPKDTISIGDIPNVLASFTCYMDNSTETCKGGRKSLSEASLNMVWAYTNSIQSLINILPDLRSLTHCSVVKNTFSDILLHQCSPFKDSIRFLWASMMSLSVIMVVLVLAWVTKASQNRGRFFFMCSIIPRSRLED